MAGCEHLRKEEGFSLVEMLVALVILAVGLLGLAMFQITAIKGNATASRWTVATELAQDRLERFRHASWGSIQDNVPSGFIPGTQPQQTAYASLPGGSIGDNTAVRGTTYYRVWNVNPNTSISPSPSFTTITVWCCWRDESAIWHNVMLVTQRANVGGM
jgi:prepilin-type N-terminal cleavage/methylation domain-containing protein